MKILPGPLTSCPAHFEDMHTHHGVPKQSANFQKSLRANATAEFDVTFGPGAEGDAAVQEAFQFALDIWASEIVSSVPIRIFADFADLGPGVLASAGPTYVVNNFDNAPVPDVYYNAALANTLAGEVLDPSQEFDLVVNIGNGINWYFGTDGNPGPGQFDFVTVALHEAGHGLGFISLDQYFADGSATFEGFNLDFTGIFNTFIVNGDGVRLTDLPSPSMELGDELTSDDLFLDGPNTQASFNGNLPKIFAPNPYNGGSSISHWNEASYPAGDPNSLMTPQVGSQESIFDIGEITRGLFRDIGWEFSVDDTGPLSVSPGVISATLPVDTVVTALVAVENSSEDALTVMAEATPGGSFISFPGSNELTIAGESTDTLAVEINTTGLPKGLYEEGIDITVVDGEDTVTVAVVILVLDGTEAPSIAVNPDAFVDTVNQGTVLTENLTVFNTGDADLTYSIDVLAAEVTGGFEARVERTRQAIAENGFASVRSVPETGSPSLSKALTRSSGDFQKLVTSLYATDFEDFNLGELDEQMGWVSQFENNYVISNANAASGSLHIRAESDGLADTRNSSTLALSPTVTPGDEVFMVATADLAITGTGTTWEFIPQSPTLGSVVTRVRFNPDRTIDILDSSINNFVRIDRMTPDGYFNIKISVDKDDASFNVFFDEELIYSGLGFANELEQIVLLSPMEETGSTFDADNLEIIDGDDEVFFLTVSPTTGTISPGDSANLAVKFDARVLDPGTYFANININSNDLDSATVIIPVTLEVLQPPTISVAPDSLSAAVDVQVDDPAIDSATFTITNTGESELTFSTGLGSTTFTSAPDAPGGEDSTLASLDLRDYGLGNTIRGEYTTVAAPSTFLTSREAVQSVPTANNEMFSDSIFYDSGSGQATDFIGLQDITVPIGSAIRFDVDEAFTLTAVRNFYRTVDIVDPVVILEVYLGGDNPNDGELLTSQTVGATSAEGAFQLEVLDEPQTFNPGETFWIVHKYPGGISFVQGIDENGIIRPGANLFSIDGGTTWDNPDDTFIILVRALTGANDSYIALDPTFGTVAPGESVEVTATFDGTELANGVYETDIVVNSNDPATPVVEVATRFEVSGQVAEVAVSDEVILFNNVFVGNEKDETLFIVNTGLAALTVTSITSDADDFTVTPQSAVVGAGDSLAVTITFTPSTTGNINGIITIETDVEENSTLEVIVNGVGVSPPIAVLSPVEVFDTVTAGETSQVEVTLCNEGDSPLIYSFPRFAAEAALAAPDVVLNNTEFISFAQPKGLTEETFVDDRQGHLIKSSVGTDLVYGYTWIDSDEEGGPVYNYVDISATGTDVTPDVGISGGVATELPFPFFFYGENYSEVFIYADGFVAFEEADGLAFINGQIPEQDFVNNLIAPFWENFNPQQGGAIYYESFVDRFVVQWSDMEESFFGGPEETATFQLVLYTDGTIDVFYEDVETYSIRNEATVGIENADATDGAQVAFNTDYIKDGLALRFLVPDRPQTAFISDISRTSGVLPAGGCRDLTVTLDATNLNDGTYFDQLTVSSNSPDGSTSTIDVTLTVVGTPELVVSADTVSFDPLFVGLELEAAIVIENSGTKELEVSSISTGTDNFFVDLETPFTLQPGGSTTVPVVFAPGEVGDLTDVITITSSTEGIDDATVVLQGTGVAPPVIEITPDALTVQVSEGASTTETLVICNTGGATLTYIVPPFTVSSDDDDDSAQLQSAGYEYIDYPAILTKEEPDTRKGPDFINASGGPGAFGYTWVDNNSGGEPYDFIDISTTGTLAEVGADGSEEVPLPFAFNFYGEEQTDIFIAANGFLSFEPVTALFGGFINQQIPTPGNPDNVIAGMWTDLEPQDGVGVFYEGNNERFIVQYEAVPSFGFGEPIAPVTFQVILFPNGSIKMQYENVDSEARVSSTVGIEGPQGETGLQVIFNSEYLTDELAITFTPPNTGSLEPGECDSVEVIISAADLDAGQYEGEIVVLSNDPQARETVIPVDLTVRELPGIARFVLVNADTDELLGTLSDGDTVDISQFPSGGFNIVAIPSDAAKVGSVIFDLNGQEGFRLERFRPFAVAGDRDNGADFNSMVFPLGENTITATPFREDDGTRESGNPLTIDFFIFDPAAPRVESFTLINADTDQAIRTLTDQDTVVIDQFPSGGFNIVAETAGVGVQSVLFNLNGRDIIENYTPYAVGGDRGPSDFKSLRFPLGENTLTAGAYAKDKARGLSAPPLTITFRVVSFGDDSNANQLVNNPKDIGNERGVTQAEVSVFPNPVRDLVNFKLGEDMIGTTEITLMSLVGQVIYRPSNIDISSNGTGSINVSNLAPGTYVLVFTDGQGNITARRKLLKQ